MSEAISAPSLEEVVSQLRMLLPDLRARYGVLALGVFGSYVRGEQDSDSDLDLLVEFDDRALSLLDVLRLKNEISDALGLKVDLVEKRALRPHIGEYILAEAVPL